MNGSDWGDPQMDQNCWPVVVPQLLAREDESPGQDPG